jgi:hypothetical protein
VSHGDLTVQCGNGDNIARQQCTARQEPPRHQRAQSVKHVNVVVERLPSKPEQGHTRWIQSIAHLNSAAFLQQQSQRRLSLGDAVDFGSIKQRQDFAINGDATHVPSKPRLVPPQRIQSSKRSTATVQVQLRGEAAVLSGPSRKIVPQYSAAQNAALPGLQRKQLVGLSLLEEASSSAKKTGRPAEQDQGVVKARNKARSPSSPPSPPRRTTRWGGSTRRQSHSMEMKVTTEEAMRQDMNLARKNHLNHLFGIM